MRKSLFVIFTALFASALTACVTSTPGPTAKQTCVEQEAVVGSRMARKTCKPEAAPKTAETKSAADVH
jgi:hypothetical protein